MKRFFYFRAEATLANDDSLDSTAADSVTIPVENISGMVQVSDTAVDVYFYSVYNNEGSNGEMVVKDKVRLTVLSGSSNRVIRALAEATNAGPHHEGITTIADDVNSVYLHTGKGGGSLTGIGGSDITACDITVDDRFFTS
jgi:hypothetical protein|tara:strand:+ start:2005 stop:2427 length:423 start_codon:yes stop_codon:yes gene_type:complete